MLLTDEELQKLTGTVQGKKQADILDQNGIYYIKRLDGSVATTWHHVNHPYSLKLKNDQEPNFEAVG